MLTPAAIQSQPRTERAWSIAVGGIGVTIFAAGLALAWAYASTLFLIFAGILLGVFLNAVTNMLGRVIPIAHGLRLTIVCLVLAAGLGGAMTLGGSTIADQAAGLSTTIKEQIGTVKAFLEKHGIDTSFIDLSSAESAGDAATDMAVASSRPHTSSSLPSAGALASGGGAVLSQTLKIVLGAIGALGNFFVVIYLGLAFAAQPTIYRKGLLWVVPRAHRAKANDIVEDVGAKLERWLVAQMIVMAAVFVITWFGLMAIGVKSAFILGVQAGLLTFIPTIGAVIGGLIVVLASLASGWVAALSAAILFFIIHALESYLLTPLLQRQAIDIPPATLFATQILLGTVFGMWGLALALPLMAVVKVVVDNFQQDNSEESRHSPDAAEAKGAA